MRFKLLFKDQCLVSYDKKIACSVGEYMQESIKADSILEQTFLDRKGCNIGTGMHKMRKNYIVLSIQVTVQ